MFAIIKHVFHIVLFAMKYTFLGNDFLKIIFYYIFNAIWFLYFFLIVENYDYVRIWTPVDKMRVQSQLLMQGDKP